MSEMQLKLANRLADYSQRVGFTAYRLVVSREIPPSRSPRSRRTTSGANVTPNPKPIPQANLYILTAMN